MSHFRVFSNCLLLSTLVTSSGISSCRISKESFEWIRRITCTKFWAQFVVRMSYFLANRSLLSIFTIVTFIYLYSPTIMQNFRKISSVDSESKMYDMFLAQFGIKMSNLEAFHHIHYFRLCLIIILYHSAKIQKSPWSGFQERANKLFGPKIDPW